MQSEVLLVAVQHQVATTTKQLDQIMQRKPHYAFISSSRLLVFSSSHLLVVDLGLNKRNGSISLKDFLASF
jgi:hypothetical protein